MRIAILLFDGVTALDAIGPYEVLSRLPGAEVQFVAESPGIKRTETRMLGLVADHATAAVREADILVVPGGFGEARVRDTPALLEWVRAIHERSRWTTSVCTGSLILGAAGVLRGLRATSHWSALEQLRSFDAEPTRERVVVQGKVITAAGVSSGIDMGLRLAQLEAGDQVAQAIQLGIEYDPAPPFDAGSPKKAPAHIVEAVRGFLENARAEIERAKTH